MEPLLNHTELESWRGGTFAGLHERLGVHPDDGGMRFAVWAPRAEQVYVTGDFSGWDERRDPMEKEPGSGIWRATVSDAKPGDRYKYAIRSQSGDDVRYKADPLAFRTEHPPKSASVVPEPADYEWGDGSWMDQRPGIPHHRRPLALYEVHLGSWKKEKGEVNYREIGEEVAAYASDMGFTHVELLPLAEHPYGASWGYQVTGFFAPTSRYGKPEELKALVDACHRQGVGVIMDWVPGHFPKDEHGLIRFDGKPLYEHPDPRRSEHPDWGTLNMNLERGEVRSFLLSSACYWCREFHIDGLRVDAVASMLYLDYSRKEGEWLPNIYGGRQHLGAVAFLQDLNERLHEEFPGVLTVAEESTDWPQVTGESTGKGLGFDFKWNMGWMNDTLHYFSLDPEERPGEHHSITFSGTYAFSERFILPFSHDEVVHLKGSLWEKMPGGEREKERNLKLLLLYWIGFPGKKLIFMGSEWGQRGEWAEDDSLEWHLLERAPHRRLKAYTAELLRLYRNEPALHWEDAGWDNFSWLDLSEKKRGIFLFERSDPEGGGRLRFLFNFGPENRELDLDPAPVRFSTTGREGGRFPGEGERPILKACSGIVLAGAQEND